MIALVGGLLAVLTGMAVLGMKQAGMVPWSGDGALVVGGLVLCWSIFFLGWMIWSLDRQEPRFIHRSRWWRLKGGWRVWQWRLLSPAETDDLIEDMQLLCDAARTSSEVEGGKAIMFEWTARLRGLDEARRTEERLKDRTCR